MFQIFLLPQAPTRLKGAQAGVATEPGKWSGPFWMQAGEAWGGCGGPHRGVEQIFGIHVPLLAAQGFSSLFLLSATFLRVNSAVMERSENCRTRRQRKGGESTRQ